MAIMNPMYDHGEFAYLRDRIRKASSAAEARHYEEKLYRLEREMSMMPHMHYEQMRMTPVPMPASLNEVLAAPETPLSFLKNADKKLLLTGATS
jgi:hypothetical protein